MIYFKIPAHWEDQHLTPQNTGWPISQHRGSHNKNFINITMVCRRMFFQGKQIVTLKLKRTLVSLSLSQHQSSVQYTQCPKHVQKPDRLQFSRCTLWQCHTGSSAWHKQSSQDSNAGPLSPNTNSHSTSVIPRVPCYCFFSVSINKITGLKICTPKKIENKGI